MNNIVITGMGIVSALGIGVRENYRALVNGMSGIEPVQFVDTKHKDTLVGEVKLNSHDLRERVGLPTEGDLSRTTAMAVAASWEALEYANIEDQKIIRVITGTTTGQTDLLDDLYFQLQCDKKAPKLIKNLSVSYCNQSIAYYSKSRLEPITVSNSMDAIILGARMIMDGKEKIVLAGGSDALTKFNFSGFRSLDITDDNICKPFDVEENGTNIGEGAAYFIMEREEDAIKRGANILAYITGWGNSCSISDEGPYKAMNEAMKSGGFEAEDIDYINANGIGVPELDKKEIRAIKRIFGNDLPNISSNKSYTGYTLSASGALETAFSILSLRKQFIPKSIEVNSSYLPKRTKRDIHNILCNSFGLGGNNSSIIISDSAKENIMEYEDNIKFKFSSEVILDEEDTLNKKIGNFISPSEARKMSLMQKAAVMTAIAACSEAEIDKPDAIIISSDLGMLYNKEYLLRERIKKNENAVVPALFLQSTHSAISATIAKAVGCDGYNIAYAEEGFDKALEDGKMLINEGHARKVLIGQYEETTELYRKIFESIHYGRRGKHPEPPKRFSAKSIILEKED